MTLMRRLSRSMRRRRSPRRAVRDATPRRGFGSWHRDTHYSRFHAFLREPGYHRGSSRGSCVNNSRDTSSRTFARTRTRETRAHTRPRVSRIDAYARTLVHANRERLEESMDEPRFHRHVATMTNCFARLGLCPREERASRREARLRSDGETAVIRERCILSQPKNIRRPDRGKKNPAR